MKRPPSLRPSGAAHPSHPHASCPTGQRGASSAGTAGPAPVGQKRCLCGGCRDQRFGSGPRRARLSPSLEVRGAAGQRAGKGSVLPPQQSLRSGGVVGCNDHGRASSRRIFRTGWAVRFWADGLLCSHHLTGEPLALRRHCPGMSLAVCPPLGDRWALQTNSCCEHAVGKRLISLPRQTLLA